MAGPNLTNNRSMRWTFRLTKLRTRVASAMAISWLQRSPTAGDRPGDGARILNGKVLALQQGVRARALPALA